MATGGGGKTEPSDAACAGTTGGSTATALGAAAVLGGGPGGDFTICKSLTYVLYILLTHILLSPACVRATGWVLVKAAFRPSRT